MSTQADVPQANVVALGDTMARRNAAHIQKIDDLTKQLLYSCVPIFTAVTLLRRECGLPPLDLP